MRIYQTKTKVVEEIQEGVMAKKKTKTLSLLMFSVPTMDEAIRQTEMYMSSSNEIVDVIDILETKLMEYYAVINKEWMELYDDYGYFEVSVKVTNLDGKTTPHKLLVLENDIKEVSKTVENFMLTEGEDLTISSIKELSVFDDINYKE